MSSPSFHFCPWHELCFSSGFAGYLFLELCGIDPDSMLLPSYNGTPLRVLHQINRPGERMYLDPPTLLHKAGKLHMSRPYSSYTKVSKTSTERPIICKRALLFRGGNNSRRTTVFNLQFLLLSDVKRSGALKFSPSYFRIKLVVFLGNHYDSLRVVTRA